MGVLLDYELPTAHSYRCARRRAAIVRKDALLKDLRTESMGLRLRLAQAEHELRAWREWWSTWCPNPSHADARQVVPAEAHERPSAKHDGYSEDSIYGVVDELNTHEDSWMAHATDLSSGLSVTTTPRTLNAGTPPTRCVPTSFTRPPSIASPRQQNAGASRFARVTPSQCSDDVDDEVDEEGMSVPEESMESDTVEDDTGGESDGANSHEVLAVRKAFCASISSLSPDIVRRATPAEPWSKERVLDWLSGAIDRALEKNEPHSGAMSFWLEWEGADAHLPLDMRSGIVNLIDQTLSSRGLSISPRVDSIDRRLVVYTCCTSCEGLAWLVLSMPA